MLDKSVNGTLPKTGLWVESFVLLLVIACLFVGRQILLQTEYSVGFADERFQRIGPGMIVDEVFKDLGPPLYFRIPDLGNQGYKTNVADLHVALSKTNYIVLEYARPRRGDAYRARQIVVQNRQVLKRDAYNYWGD